jgi:phosphopantothenoylcysteine decarboxylase / phosphopantothenate---cysteine ligase
MPRKSVSLKIYYLQETINDYKVVSLTIKQIKTNHPSKEIIGVEGNQLISKKIVLCITGSVAAYRAIDLSRLLMRHGAEVHPVMTNSAASFITKEIMKWATGNDVVTSLTPNLEHIELADYNKSDLIIVYPCTANTIGKFASGIDDSPVTTLLSVGIGSGIPILIAPAMHQSMYENKIIVRNIMALKTHGVLFVEPIILENKAKIASPIEVLDFVLKVALKTRKDQSKKVLITAGSTIERIDPVRVLTNLSSGKMGLSIANMASRLGHEVILIYGHGQVDPPANANLKAIRVETASQMYEKVKSEVSTNCPDVVFHCAAVSDYTFPNPLKRKINSTKKELKIRLKPTKKIVNEIKKWNKKVILVAFKAEYNVSSNSLIVSAIKKLKECDADFIVANDLSTKGGGYGSGSNEVFVIDRYKKITHLPIQDKDTIAKKLLGLIIGNEL